MGGGVGTHLFRGTEFAMSKTLYITAAGPHSGKSAIALGVMQLLSTQTSKIAVFRPIIAQPEFDKKDSAINLFLEYFKLEQNYCDTFAYTEDEAYDIINRDSKSALEESILKKFKALEAKYDFVLCLGTDFRGKDAAFEFELNADIAGNIGAPVLLVVSGKDKNLPELRQIIHTSMDTMTSHCDLVSTVINRSNLSNAELSGLRSGFARDGEQALIYAIPEDKTLGSPTLGDVARSLDAEFICGSEHPEVLVSNFLIAAMHVDHFLSYLEKDLLIITPGDRSDILLTAIAAKVSNNQPNISGVLLTGGLRPSDATMEILKGITAAPLPILVTQHHTFRASQFVQQVQGTIEPCDARKVNTALGLFEHYVDGKAIAQKITASAKPRRVTPLMFEYNLLERARQSRQRIVLCEGEEPRILQATDILLRREAADIILLGDKQKIVSKAAGLGLDISRAEIINPLTSPKFEDYANSFYEYRKQKGVTIEQARDTMMDSTYFGTMMVKKGDADGMVSGAINTTAHTIRPAFQFIKARPGFSVVSSVFLMCLKDRVLVFGDCAVNPNPTADQLAEIAITSAHTAELFGIEPRVAMLSYSTGNSGKGADVDVVKEATRIAKEKAPELMLEGPLQYDAAIDPTVAKTKLPNSQVAGRATVFIFPDLNTGNNTYKAVQRAAGAIAIGPVLQGLRKPVNDLSRGCLVPDIVNTVVITAIQAAAEKAAEKA